MNWLLVAEIAGIAYLLWVFYVVALVSSLKEIKKSNWHYKPYHLYDVFDGTDVAPKDSCAYGRRLMLFPPLFLFLLVFLPILSSFFFLIQWVIIPFFIGKIPVVGFVVSAKAFFIPTYDSEIKSFMRFSPFIYLLLLGLVFGVGYELSKVWNGQASPREANFVFLIIGTVVMTIVAVWFATKPSTKTMWGMVKGKLCRRLPVSE